MRTLAVAIRSLSNTYDAAGNILKTKKDGTTTHRLTYGHAAWKDLLTAVDAHTITYDGAGNPTSYHNGVRRWNMTWDEGRRLVYAYNSDANRLYFSYDSEGLRLSKTYDGVVHSYSYAGGKLLRETWGSNTLDFFYDSTGNPYAVKYNGTLYYYITNLQGDVLHIVDTSGNTVVSYTYSPYGKPLTTTGSLAATLGAANPLRYRGYVYDQETGYYYLQSRYYDPEIGRFINADSYASTGQGILGCNMFAYCNNSPINSADPSGNWPSATAKFNPNAMTFMSGSIQYWGPCPWDEEGHLKETIITNYEIWQSEMEEAGYVHLINGTKDITSGVKNIKKGAGMLFAPIPTVVDDVIGVGWVTYGVLQFAGGITKITIAIFRGESD